MFRVTIYIDADEDYPVFAFDKYSIGQPVTISWFRYLLLRAATWIMQWRHGQLGKLSGYFKPRHPGLGAPDPNSPTVEITMPPEEGFDRVVIDSMKEHGSYEGMTD